MDQHPANPLPTDRSHLDTEKRNPRSESLHTMSAAQLVDLIRSEDAAVHHAMEKAGPAINSLIQAAEPGFCAGGRLIYLGAGTSGRLGVLDASEAPPTFDVPPGRVVGIIAGGDAALRRSSEGMEDDPRGAHAELDALKLTEHDTLIGIAAGGTTPYVHGALEYAHSVCDACVRGLIVCTSFPKPAYVQHLVVLETGPEVITGSTRMKAGTATKLTLNTISTALMIRSGRVYGNLMVDMRATNAKLRDRAARIIAHLTGLDRREAFALLDRAGGAVKIAVVMHRLGVDRPEATERLNKAHGRLHNALTL